MIIVLAGNAWIAAGIYWIHHHSERSGRAFWRQWWKKEKALFYLHSIQSYPFNLSAMIQTTFGTLELSL